MNLESHFTDLPTEQLKQEVSNSGLQIILSRVGGIYLKTEDPCRRLSIDLREQPKPDSLSSLYLSYQNDPNGERRNQPLDFYGDLVRWQGEIVFNSSSRTLGYLYVQGSRIPPFEQDSDSPPSFSSMLDFLYPSGEGDSQPDPKRIDILKGLHFPERPFLDSLIFLDHAFDLGIDILELFLRGEKSPLYYEKGSPNLSKDKENIRTLGDYLLVGNLQQPTFSDALKDFFCFKQYLMQVQASRAGIITMIGSRRRELEETLLLQHTA